MDLAEIWIRGQIIGVDSESEVIFILEANIKPILAIFCNFASKKRQVTDDIFENSIHRF